MHGFAADITAEQEKLAWCELMIWQFPLWWFGIPAILKGWADRVLAMGTAYGDGRFYETGVYTGKKALLSLSIGGQKNDYLNDGSHGDMDNMLKPIHRGILQFTGFSILEPQVVYGPARQTAAERAEALAEWVRRLKQINEEATIEITTY